FHPLTQFIPLMTWSMLFFIYGLHSLHSFIRSEVFWFSGSYITIHLITSIKLPAPFYIPMVFCFSPLCFSHSQRPSWLNTLILIMLCLQLYSMAWQVSLIHLHGSYLSALFRNQNGY